MRNFLLDTHALIWFITDNSQLPANTKKLIENKQNGCFVSIVSLWEISIKHSIGKLQLGTSLEEIFKLIAQTEFDILHISPNHLLQSAKLPFHHRDPFDRILIAQAICENHQLVSRDGIFQQYEVGLVWE